MKKHIALVTAICIAVTAGCKKKDNSTSESNENTNTTTSGSPIAVEPVYKIKTMVISAGGMSSSKTYKYDKEGRQIQSSLSNGFSFTTEWSSDKVILTYFYPSGEQSYKITYNLNAAGQATSSSGDGSDQLFEYSADGYLSKSSYTTIAGSSASVYTTTSGNLAKTETVVAGNKSTGSYEYYTDKKNTIGDDNTGFAIFGKQNTNLVKSLSEFYSGSSTPYSTTYSYEFDSRNRVSKMTSETVSGISVVSYEYVE